MARTNDWVNTVPIDHTKFKAQPGHVRDVRIDIEDRLSSILYGFATSLETENFNAFKKVPFMDWGTPSTPAGTGSAAAYILFGSSHGGQVELFGIDSGANVMQFTSGGSVFSLGYIKKDGTIELTANWDAGAYAITALRFISDQATGTAPLTVASTTKVTNLNADLLDGLHMSTGASANVIYQSGADNYLPDGTVDTTALKTTLGTAASAGHDVHIALPGGEYGFYPSIKSSDSGNGCHVAIATGNVNLTTSYATQFSILDNAEAATITLQQRYVTASGIDHWIFLSIDKNTKEIISLWEAPDHPSYGNSNNPETFPHPFLSYDSSKDEIILVEKETALALLQEKEQIGEGLLDLIIEEYKADMSKKHDYVPLHSGKFESLIPVMIETIPDYISVRKLTKLTQGEKNAREAKRAAQAIADEAKKQAREAARVSGKAKLKTSAPLNQEEVEALFE